MPSSTETKSKGDTDAYFSRIPNCSSLVGKTAGEVMKSFENKLIINQVVRPLPNYKISKRLLPETIFQGGMRIRIFGDRNDIYSFVEKFNLL